MAFLQFTVNIYKLMVELVEFVMTINSVVTTFVVANASLAFVEMYIHEVANISMGRNIIVKKHS